MTNYEKLTEVRESLKTIIDTEMIASEVDYGYVRGLLKGVSIITDYIIKEILNDK